MWKVIRHSGRKNEEWKVRYEGSREVAAEKFVGIKKKLRLGGVALVNPTGEITARVTISKA